MSYFSNVGVDYTKFFTDMTDEERDAFSQGIADRLKESTPASTPQTPMYIDGKVNPEWQEQEQKKYTEKKKKAEEIRDNAYADTLEMFSDLDALRSENTSSFNLEYSSLNLDDKKKYLYHLYDSGKLNKKEYKNQVNNLFSEKFKELSDQGIYEGYVPYEHGGQTFLAPARFFNPDNKRKLNATEVAGMSILPNDSFYFPDERIGTEKEWLSGKVTEYGQTVTSWQNPNYHMPATLTEKGDETASSRAREILLPDKTFGERLGSVLAPAAVITGNPLVSALSAGLQGADIGDIAKSAAKTYAIGQVTAPILENIITPLGIDKDLFGMDAETFSESTMDVQTAILEGKDIEEALLKEFGVPAVKQIAGAVGDMLPDINLPDSEIFDELGKVVKPVIEVVKEGGRFIDDTVLQPVKENVLEPVVDVAQKGIDVVQTATQPISDVTSDIEDVVKEAGREFDDTFLEPWTEPTGEFLSEAEDVVKDLGREFDKNVLQPIGDVLEAGGDFLGGMLGGGQQDYQQRGISQTPVEQLFDKELFKFDTEIKSTQEMLSPMMNLRRYG